MPHHSRASSKLLLLWLLSWSLEERSFVAGFLSTVHQPTSNKQKSSCLPDYCSKTVALSASTPSSNHDRRKKKKKRANLPPRSKETQTWRVFNVEVHPDELQLDLHKERNIKNQSDRQALQEQFLLPAVLESLSQRIRVSLEDDWKIRVVRRSLDARGKKRRQDGRLGPRFVYVMDIDIPPTTETRLRHQPGKCECLGAVAPSIQAKESSSVSDPGTVSEDSKRVIIVGAGPAGLFCALRLAKEPGITPILLERGQAVEIRGKDIGALMHRKVLQPESNYAFGEGGAGTWSDGKLTTRIGRNSDVVRHVLETLVEYGAPPWILLDGSPHLGTDNLVRLLRNMRLDLRRMGGQVHFGTRVTGFLMEGGKIQGVQYEHQKAMERNLEQPSASIGLEDEGVMRGDAVVLATGHSARDVYEQLHAAGVQLEPKGFAVGFRIEHPQKLINKIQYGGEWGPSVVTGKGTTDEENSRYFIDQSSREENTSIHQGRLPVPSYRLATDKAYDGKVNRGVYSFCMCPGGQIVPASTDPEEVCVNGMSFSRRDSLWANSALVVTVNPDDPVLEPYREQYGVLAGIAFQRDMERKAALMGGGNLCVPVQRVTDFVAGRPSTSNPSSSYRLSVKPSACHEIYPAELTASLRHALMDNFEKQMPGYVCDDGLLHGIETRTSSPVRVSRDDSSLQAVGMSGMFPAGEGAGFAGGIVSAAVDGHTVAEAVLRSFQGGTLSKEVTSQVRSQSSSSKTENKMGTSEAPTRRNFMAAAMRLPLIASFSSFTVGTKPCFAVGVSFQTKANAEYTNSITASRDTNVSPKEAYDSILQYLPPNRGEGSKRALDVGAGAGLSTSYLYNNLGYKVIDAVDWSGDAWQSNVMTTPESVRFFELDDDSFFMSVASKDTTRKYDVICYNFAINPSKAVRVARSFLTENGVLFAPVNDRAEYWYKQTYYTINAAGEILKKSGPDVGAWSVQVSCSVKDPESPTRSPFHFLTARFSSSSNLM
jgi:uncharacterized FAD-dependent dehydrogenase/SAM-dependent methyltransferase